MVIDTRNLFNLGVLENYENFLMKQPHLVIKGLYQLENKYYIVIPELNNETLAFDNGLLESWYERNSIIGCNTKLSNKIPLNSIKVQEYTKDKIADLYGKGRNNTFFYFDIIEILPKSFPDFKLINSGKGDIRIIFEKDINEIEFQQLNNAIIKMGYPIKMYVEVNKDYSQIDRKLLEAPLLLIPSKTLPSIKDSKFNALWESDEDFWSSNKYKIYDAKITKQDFALKGVLTKNSSCIISDTIRPDNIRNFLTIYETIFIVLPIMEHHEMYFNALGISLEELSHLVQLRRVKLVLNQPLQRYHPRLLGLVITLNDSDYILSRRLACMVVTELRKRIPLLYPTIPAELRYSILHVLNKVYGENDFMGIKANSLINILSDIWQSDYIEGIQRQGAYGILQNSFYKILDGIIKQKTSQDLGFEILTNIYSVDYAATLESNLIPSTSGYDSQNLCLLISNIYTGIPKEAIIKKVPDINTTVENILTISKEVPIKVLAESFQNSDIDRFRGLIFGLTQHERSTEELNDSIIMFNSYVRNFENSKKRQGILDIKGLLLEIATGALAPNITIASWIVERIRNIIILNKSASKFLNPILDEIDGGVHGTLPDAILVARLRNGLKDGWYESKFQ